MNNNSNVLAVGLITGISVAVHAAVLFCYKDVPLWWDEAHTYWLVQGSLSDVTERLRGEVVPPLYLWLMWLVTSAFGDSEFVLRLPSALAGVAVAPMLYWTGKKLGNETVGRLAGGMAAIHPLLTYYCVEARVYSFFALTSVCVLLSFVYALQRSTVLHWIVFGVATAALLNFHHYGVLLLPAPVVVAAFVRSTNRFTVVRNTIVAELFGFLSCVSWLRGALQSNEGIEWLRTLWNPWFALIHSVELLGFGGMFHPHHLHLNQAPTIPVVGLIVSAVVLFSASRQKRESKEQADGPFTACFLLWAFFALPLVLAWLYSCFRQPIYLPGRYDIIALPPLLVLLAIGVERLWSRSERRWMPIAIGVWIVGTSVSATYFMTIDGQQSIVSEEALEPNSGRRAVDPLAVKYLSKIAEKDDLLVCLGMRFVVTNYYAQKFDLPCEIVTFPSWTEQRPGWYWPEAVAKDRQRLLADARQLIQLIERTIDSDGKVWLAPATGFGQGDKAEKLLAELSRKADLVPLADQSGYGIQLIQLIREPDKPGRLNSQ